MKTELLEALEEASDHPEERYLLFLDEESRSQFSMPAQYMLKTPMVPCISPTRS